MLLDVTSAIGEYCTKVAWISVISSVSAQLTLRFPDTVRERVFKAGEPTRMASVIVTPGATALREGDGYRVSGEWPFGSNILNSEWAIGVVHIKESDDAEPELGYALMHKDQYTIKDTRYTIGMRGTGSNTFIAEDQWLPADQIQRADAMLGPGFEMAADSHFLQRLTPVSMFPTVIIAGPVGAAKAALAFVAEASKRRPVTYSKYAPQNTSGAFVQGIGAARAKIDAAEMSLQRAADMIDAAAQGTTPLSMQERAHIRNFNAHATQNLADAVNDLAWLLGTATFAEASLLARLRRDVKTGTRHAIAAWPLCYEIGGAGYLGLDSPTPLV